jgi:hypothetical protein
LCTHDEREVLAVRASALQPLVNPEPTGGKKHDSVSGLEVITALLDKEFLGCDAMYVV